MLKHLNRHSRGDTIVEVMIALAILSFALTTSFSTVNRSMQSAQSSQEHSEALQYLNSQVEMARASAGDDALYAIGTFCMNDTTAQRVRFDTTNSDCKTGTDDRYVLKITYAATPVGGIPQDFFTFTVTWPGIGSLGQQQEQLSYKIHKP